MQLRNSIKLFIISCVLMIGCTMHVYAGDMPGTMTSVKIVDETGAQIHITASVDPTVVSADEEIYLFELKPYQKDLQGRYDPLDAVDIASKLEFTVDLFTDDGDNRLYSAFCLAVNAGDHYEMISYKHYITNPEILSGDSSPARNKGIKGLVVDSDYQAAIGLGIQHAAINIATTNFFGRGISYTFKGKQYSISADTIASLDTQISMYSAAGVAVTAIILNAWNEDATELNPSGMLLPTEKAAYYQFPTETEEAVETLEAMSSFLAKRYNGRNGCGKISNWVIGNEINNQYWNYSSFTDIWQYVQRFQDAFRIFYTSIKAESASDQVMFSIDHYWAMPTESQPAITYAAKAVVDVFSAFDRQEGSIDWGLALHPYPYPMDAATFWKERDPAYGVAQYFTDDANSPVVDFVNLHVITDYMKIPVFLNPAGQTRTIFLTEEGFSSMKGTQDMSQEQAAAVAYSYYIVKHNPYIKAYILSRQDDHPYEAGSGLNIGLSTIQMDGSRVPKPAREVFRLIDTAQSAAVSDFAKTIIGISDWGQLIPGFQYP